MRPLIELSLLVWAAMKQMNGDRKMNEGNVYESSPTYFISQPGFTPFLRSNLSMRHNAAGELEGRIWRYYGRE
jgi:hypothetical protein